MRYPHDGDLIEGFQSLVGASHREETFDGSGGHARTGGCSSRQASSSQRNVMSSRSLPLSHSRTRYSASPQWDAS